MRSDAGLRFRFRRAPATPSAAGLFEEPLALFGRHLLPALVHSMTPAPSAAAHRTAPHAAEKQPAQNEQRNGLPERNRLQSEDRRHKPVPQVHYDPAKRSQ